MEKRIFLVFITAIVLISSTWVSAAGLDYFQHQTWEEIFQDERTVDYPIIFIHGMAGDIGRWDRVRNILVGDRSYEMGFFEEEKIYHDYFGGESLHWVWSVSYYTNKPIDESLNGDLALYSERVRDMIENIKKITGKDKVILIAHSMGGLLARKYMTMSQANWDSVHKIVTLGTPNLGVSTSIGIVGQLKDVKEGSEFLKNLNSSWTTYYAKEPHKKWGVVGGIKPNSLYNNFTSEAGQTDGGGPGFVAIYSSIPEEWDQALSEINQPAYDTQNYGFRMLTTAQHLELRFHESTFLAIHWAVQDW